MTTLAQYLALAVDATDPVAIDAINGAITLINATRVNIAAAVADGGSAAAVKAHISGEEVTVLGSQPKGSVPKAVTPNHGPAAMFGKTG